MPNAAGSTRYCLWPTPLRRARGGFARDPHDHQTTSNAEELAHARPWLTRRRRARGGVARDPHARATPNAVESTHTHTCPRLTSPRRVRRGHVRLSHFLFLFILNLVYKDPAYNVKGH